MAYSTQREFFHVPYWNELIEFECRRECVKLKSYESTIDDRSWAIKDEDQSRYLSDLVTCRTPVLILDPRKEECTDKEQREGKCTKMECTDKEEREGKCTKIECTEKEQREGKCIKTGDKNNKNINNKNTNNKNIVGGPDGDTGDPDHMKNNLKSDLSQLKPNDSLIHAANNALGRLEDLLQEKDDLKSELACSKNYLNKALKERDELRERLKCFKEMENRIADLLKKSKEVGRTQHDLTQNLRKQANCIEKMKDELRRSEEYYEQKLQGLMKNEQRLRRQNCELKAQLSRYRLDHKRMYSLQKENTSLCYELQKLQDALTECDCQYEQLMRKVCLFKDQGYSMNSGSKMCSSRRCGSCDS